MKPDSNLFSSWAVKIVDGPFAQDASPLTLWCHAAVTLSKKSASNVTGISQGGRVDLALECLQAMQHLWYVLAYHSHIPSCSSGVPKNDAAKWSPPENYKK